MCIKPDNKTDRIHRIGKITVWIPCDKAMKYSF